MFGSCDREGGLGGGAVCLPDCAREKAKGKRQKRRGKNMRSAIFFAGKCAAARVSILTKLRLVVGGSSKLPTARLPPDSCVLRSAFWLFIMTFDTGRLRDKLRAIPQNLLTQAPLAGDGDQPCASSFASSLHQAAAAKRTLYSSAESFSYRRLRCNLRGSPLRFVAGEPEARGLALSPPRARQP